MEKELINVLFHKAWVVYAKQLFIHPKAVLEYLGRYTHKVAFSNHLILDIDQNQNTFSYKDYRQALRSWKCLWIIWSLSEGFPCIFCQEDLSEYGTSESLEAQPKQCRFH